MTVGAILYSIFGQQIVCDIYDGRLPFTSITVFSGEPHRPLEYYLDRADTIVWQFIVVGLPLTLVFWTLFISVCGRLLSSHDRTYTTTPSIPRRQSRHDILLAASLYSVITLLYCIPILSTFSDAMLGPPEDNMLSYWNFWYLRDIVLHEGGSLVYTNYIYFPEGTSMYYHAWTFYNLGLSFILRAFFDPVAIYNIIVLHTFPLAGVGAFLLVRYITRNSYIALLGGFIFAFSPFHVARVLHHVNLSSIQFIPLFVLFFIKVIREGKLSNLILATVFLLLNALCDLTYMIFAIYFALLSYIYLGIRRRKIILPDVLWKSTIIVGVSLLIASPWLWQMIKLAFLHPETGGSGRTDYVADLLGYLVPGHYHLLGMTGIIDQINSSFSGNYWEAATYLGVSALMVVTIASRKHMRLIAVYLLGAIAFFPFTFGPELHIAGLAIPVALPDTVIALLPLLSNIRAPSRYVVYVYLFWSIAVALSTAYLIQAARTARLKKLLLIAIPLLLFIDYYTPYSEKTEISVPQCYGMIPETDQQFGILDLPNGYVAVNSYMLYQTEHGYPIVQGWASRKIGKSLIDSLDIADMEHQKKQLTDNSVKYVVLHKDLQIEEKVYPEQYEHIYELVYEDARNAMYQVY